MSRARFERLMARTIGPLIVTPAFVWWVLWSGGVL